ncbi:MAG: SRPBCC domain-containing protein [Ardenticatenaceae bacterium]|nr:SRPBCC domain-containing protein [Ardenticatenaceae bacterium]MCB8948724.1 SRPBCC domain-containing protein [Ardenticatenaceae bacterium]
MKEFSASTNIAASPETIWNLLTDANSYPEWDPGMIRLEGTIAPGEKVTAYTKLSPNQAFPVTVTHFVPNKTMTWTGGMPLGLFKGERTFTLEPQADGTTQFTTREQFSGLLLPIFGRTIPDLSESFQNFAAGLKKRAESS